MRQFAGAGGEIVSIGYVCWEENSWPATSAEQALKRCARLRGRASPEPLACASYCPAPLLSIRIIAVWPAACMPRITWGVITITMVA